VRPYRRAQWLLVIYLAIVGAAAFWPSPIDAPLSGPIGDYLAKLHRHGVPDWFNYLLVEFCANVALFFPWGALLACLLTKNLWVAAALSSFVASSFIELGQFLLLSERFATWQDIGANTFGALLGAGAVTAIRLRGSKKLQRVESPPG